MDLLLYGLQRSGTNILESALLENSNARFLNEVSDRANPKQKHFRFYQNKKLVPHRSYSNDVEVKSFAEFERLLDVRPDNYLIISKDPYSWLLSYQRWAEKCQWEILPHHYIEEYNAFYNFFKGISEGSDRVIFVRYRDLIADYCGELSKLVTTTNGKLQLAPTHQLTLPERVSHSSVFTEQREVYYLNALYLNEYSNQEKNRLNRLLDPELVEFLGYEFR